MALEILNEPVTGSFIVLTNMINTLFKDKKSIPHFLWCGRPSHAFCGDFCSNIFCGAL